MWEAGCACSWTWRKRAIADAIAYAVALGATQLLLYVIGLPLVALFFMRRNNKRMGVRVVVRYGMVYSGYGQERYYWEVIVALRKAAIVATSTFGTTLSIEIQTHVALLVVMLGLGMHMVGRPFADERLHRLEAGAWLSAGLRFGQVAFMTTARCCSSAVC